MIVLVFAIYYIPAFQRLFAIVLGAALVLLVLLRWRHWRHRFLMWRVKRLENKRQREAEEAMARARIVAERRSRRLHDD